MELYIARKGKINRLVCISSTYPFLQISLIKVIPCCQIKHVFRLRKFSYLIILPYLFPLFLCCYWLVINRNNWIRSHRQHFSISGREPDTLKSAILFLWPFGERKIIINKMVKKIEMLSLKKMHVDFSWLPFLKLVILKENSWTCYLWVTINCRNLMNLHADSLSFDNFSITANHHDFFVYGLLIIKYYYLNFRLNKWRDGLHFFESKLHFLQ